MNFYSTLGQWMLIWTLVAGGYGTILAFYNGGHLPAHWIPVILGAGGGVGGGIAGCLYGMVWTLFPSASRRIHLISGWISGMFAGWAGAVYGLGITIELGLLGGSVCGVLSVLLTFPDSGS